MLGLENQTIPRGTPPFINPKSGMKFVRRGHFITQN
jgi:hypothetical protein